MYSTGSQNLHVSPYVSLCRRSDFWSTSNRKLKNTPVAWYMIGVVIMTAERGVWHISRNSPKSQTGLRSADWNPRDMIKIGEAYFFFFLHFATFSFTF